MKKVIRQRINDHIKRNLPITQVLEDAGDMCCGWCGVLFLDDESYKPNFCPECGCLLDWTKKEDEPSVR